MDKKCYQELQDIKNEEVFKYMTNQKIQNLDSDLQHLQECVDKLIASGCSDKKGTDIQLQNMTEVCMSTLKEFKQTLGNMSTDLINNKNWMKQVRSEVEECVSIYNFNEKISHLHDCVKLSHAENESMRKEFKDLIERLKADFDSKLKAMKEEIISRPSEIPDLRKMIDQKIELVELNGQNSLLRSSNNEKQILLVERKIENIYQLIKKFELAKQE